MNNKIRCRKKNILLVILIVAALFLTGKIFMEIRSPMMRIMTKSQGMWISPSYYDYYELYQFGYCVKVKEFSEVNNVEIINLSGSAQGEQERTEAIFSSQGEELSDYIEKIEAYFAEKGEDYFSEKLFITQGRYFFSGYNSSKNEEYLYEYLPSDQIKQMAKFQDVSIEQIVLLK